MSTLLTNVGMQLPSDQEASGRTLGHEELNYLAEVIASGTLTSTKGTFVKKFEDEFAKKLGVKFAYACASGTAAIHTAVAALDPVTYLPSLKIKSFRLQQTVSEPVTPGSAKNRISSAVPLRTEIAKYQNAKDLAKAWQAAGLSGWIKQQLRPETPNKAVAASSLLKGLTVDAGRF